MSGEAYFWRRARLWYWVFGALIYISGAVSGAFGDGFIRYTTWYIDDTNRATALKSLSTNSELILKRIDGIDALLRDQAYTNQTAASLHKDFAEHLHALDARADADRASMAEMHELIATQKERILYLLDPKQLPARK